MPTLILISMLVIAALAVYRSLLRPVRYVPTFKPATRFRASEWRVRMVLPRPWGYRWLYSSFGAGDSAPILWTGTFEQAERVCAELAAADRQHEARP